MFNPALPGLRRGARCYRWRRWWEELGSSFTLQYFANGIFRPLVRQYGTVRRAPNRLCPQCQIGNLT
jgi:hypothetical protein